VIALGRFAVATHLRLLRAETREAAELLPPDVTMTTLVKAELVADSLEGVADRARVEELETLCLSLAGARREVGRLAKQLRSAPVVEL
jgi:hypothetical protein